MFVAAAAHFVGWARRIIKVVKIKEEFQVKKGIIPAVLAATLAVPALAQSPAPAGNATPAPAASKPAVKKAAKAKKAKLSRYKATVVSVDKANRKLTLKRHKGKQETIEDIVIPADVSIMMVKSGKGKKKKTAAFEQIAVGDQVFVYYLGDVKNPKAKPQIKKVSLLKRIETDIKKSL